jgi:nucleoside-diphosphate-sugar epimerase
MPRILITGTNSFIGTNFCKTTRFEDHTEISLRKNEISEIDFSKFDVILHLAAIVHQSKITDSKKYYKVNKDLPVILALKAKNAGVRQFIFLSTIKVYGKHQKNSEPWNENSPCYPDDAYGKSKYEAEIELKKLECSSFTVSIVRTPIVYGPGVGANILKLIKLIEAFPLLPFKNVKNNRHYTFVDNMVGFLDRIIELKASGTFIVMDDEPLSTTELVIRMSKLLHKNTRLFRFPAFITQIGIYVFPSVFDRLYGSFYLDNSKTKRILNYSPPFTAEEGLLDLISSYLSDKDRAGLKD